MSRSKLTRLRTCTALLLASQLLVTSAAPAFAAPAAAKTVAKKKLVDQLPPEARKHFESAVLLYEDANFQGALTEFRTAFELSGDARVLRNVAVCEKGLMRYSAAIDTLQRVLAEGKLLETDFVDQVKSEIEVLLPLTALVTFELSETGAEVSIDGRTLRAESMVGPVRVDVGERTFLVKKPGFVDATQKASMVGGSSTKLTFVLEPVVKLGHLKVTVSALPKGVVASVQVDGIPVGNAPWEGDLAAGKHAVEISAPGFVTLKLAREVQFKEKADVTVSLAKERHEGTLTIETGEDKALISLDGKVVGSGTFRGTMPSGGHTLNVSLDGHKPYSTEVTILDDQNRTVSVKLEQEKSTWMWWVGGGVALVGVGVGAYFLFRPKDEDPVAGTIDPGVVSVPLRRNGYWAPLAW